MGSKDLVLSHEPDATIFNCGEDGYVVLDTKEKTIFSQEIAWGDTEEEAWGNAAEAIDEVDEEEDED